MDQTDQGPPSSIVVDDGIQLYSDSLFSRAPDDQMSSPPLGRIIPEPIPEAHTSLLELGEETMAQAMLIFLLVDLRILSATGRIRTKFEHLALDSDRSPRLTSQDYAGFYDYEETDGVTASHIMGVLLVEILREAEDVAMKRNKNKGGLGRRRRQEPTLLSPWSGNDDARKIFKRDIRAANGMPSLLHCYNEMLQEDVNPKIARVSRKLYPLDEDLADGLGSGTAGGWYEGAADGEDLLMKGANSHGWEYPGGDTYQDEELQGEESISIDTWTEPLEDVPPPPIPAPSSLAAGTTPLSASSAPAGKNSSDHVRIQRSISMGYHPFPQRRHSGEMKQASQRSEGAASVGGPSAAAVTPKEQAEHMHRRASTNMQVAHFNPYVEEDEMDNDDDSVNQFEALLAKASGNMTSKKHQPQQPTSEALAPLEPVSSSSVLEDSFRVTENPERRDSSGSLPPEAPTPPAKPDKTHPPSIIPPPASFFLPSMNTSMPTLNFKDLRERVEKAIPENLAHRVNELTKTREQKELDEIAQVQSQLLNWGYSEELLAAKDENNNDDGSKGSRKSVRKRLASDPSATGPNRTHSGGRILFGGHRTKLKDEDADNTLNKAPFKNNQAKETEVSSSANAGGRQTQEPDVEGAATTSAVPVDATPEHHDADTIRQLILQALDKRDFWRLNFIKTFFREGTVSHVLANSRAEMVWLSDWHTQHECTYAISIDREKKKALLAFRGAYSESDWRHIVDWYDTATSNPVTDDYPGRPTNIRMHSGFHRYLFRVRKDTGTTKYDEIAAKLSHYCKITGRNTRITITGHSLGAALACIFALYASTEERFTNGAGAIECVTFGTPCIGNWRFAGAVKHQENVGKLRVAKFRVKGDSVPHLPPSLARISSKGAQYWHSGIDVSLPYIRKGKIWRTFLGGQPKPTVTYWDPDEESYFGSLFRQVREYYIWNLPIRFWRFALFHTLVEHKKRMALVSKSDPNSPLAKYSLQELYEMRDELTRRPPWRRKKKKNSRTEVEDSSSR